MRFDWRQFLARGEFFCFLLAWVLGIAAAMAEYHGRSGPPTGNDMAATNGAVELLESWD